MALARNNHYLPEFYLRRWCASDGKLPVYSLLVPNENVPLWVRRSLRYTGSVSDLYISSIASEDSDELELWLNQEIETPAAEAIALVVEGHRMQPADWERLIRFYALQEARTPSRLHIYREFAEAYFRDTLGETIENSVQKLERLIASGQQPPAQSPQPGPSIPLKIATHIAPEATYGVMRAEVLVGRESWHHSIHNLVTSTYRALLNHKWTVLRAPDGLAWPTSDHPSVCTLNGRFFGLDKSFGWLTNGVELLLPLSPSHLLYAKSGTYPALKGSAVTVREARRLIHLILQRAHRVVISQSESSEVPALRPRYVNREQYLSELTAWGSFHSENSNAVRSLGSPITDSEIPHGHGITSRIGETQ